MSVPPNRDPPPPAEQFNPCRNPCNYMDYCSYADPGGMEG